MLLTYIWAFLALRNMTLEWEWAVGSEKQFHFPPIKRFLIYFKTIIKRAIFKYENCRHKCYTECENKTKVELNRVGWVRDSA